MFRKSAPQSDKATAPKSNRGFFAVLMLCLIAVGGVAVTTFSDSLHAPTTDTDSTSAPSATATTVTTHLSTTAAPVAVKPATTTATTTTTVTTASSSANDASLLFQLPLTNKVLTPYSEQPLYNTVLDSYRTHTAVDFDGEEGQSVKPLAVGTVTDIQEDALWGGCITVDHGKGVISVYRGLAVSVNIGDEVSTDSVLGKLADVPCENDLGPHLHFELYKDGKAADVSVLFDNLTS